MIKKIIGISAAALCAVTVTACSGGTNTGNVSDKETASEHSADDAQQHGAVLALPDISGDMKAKGAKKDLTELVNKYKPLVTLSNYKGIKVTKGDAYEMTDEEVQEDLDMLVESLKKYEDVTEGGTTQTGDALTLTTEATLDGQPYEAYSLKEQFYELGSEMITEDFDKQLTGRKAGEDFEMNVKFPDEYVSEEYLQEGEVSLNGKTMNFKTNISKIERAVEEQLNDEWVKNHQADLAGYGYDGVNTLDELKSKIKSVNNEERAKSLLEERGGEALKYVIKESKFSSYPEDELNTLKEQTKENIKQEYEAYKDMMGVSSLEEYLESSYEIKGDDALEKYATEQAQQYLQNKMTVTLIADDAGIEVGEEDIKKIGDDMARYYGFDNYEAMIEQYGDTVKDSALFEALYSKVISYLGSQADASLEPEESTDDMDHLLPEEETEPETAVAE